MGANSTEKKRNGLAVFDAGYGPATIAITIVASQAHLDGFEIGGQAARPISTAKLNALQRLHLRPINLVIFQGPSEGLRPGRSHLEAGFALRCLQRLSLPDIATQRCSWRNSWHTSGPSTPVLSY